MMQTRTEADLLGEMQVPADALFGVQTLRALENFPVRGYRAIGSYPTLVNALIQIKHAAALTNLKIGILTQDQARAIVAAAEELLRSPRADQFPLHALHGGGGTSANMNANEVLANLGEEKLGGQRGQYRLLHPNDHVNLNQSTNDVYPTACHMAVIAQWQALDRALQYLSDALTAKGVEYQNVPHLSRTCFQDAVEITFGDLFRGYASFVNRARERCAQAVAHLHTVNLGGTIVGRAADVPDAYMREIIPALRAVTGDDAFHHADSLFDAAQNADELAAVSAQLDLLARGLIKIAQDFRILGSGPEAGLGEITLPAVQPGSSIMPGKVNPVIPEFLIQSCFEVMGKHVTCVAGLNQGELDLNVWESSMVFSILDAMELLENGIHTFADKCVRGVTVNFAVNSQHADTLIPLLTRLVREHGYSRVTAICKQARGQPDQIRKLIATQLGKPS